MFRFANAAALAVFLLFGAVFPAQAGTFTLATDFSSNSGADLRFNALCGGPDSFNCEYTVGDVRAGNRAPNGDSELIIYDRLNFTGSVGGATAQASPFSATTDFLVSYRVGGGITLSGFDNSASFNIDLGSIPTSANNPDAAPQSWWFACATQQLRTCPITARPLPTNPRSPGWAMAVLGIFTSG